MKLTQELKSSSRDIKLLWASVFLRLLSYGFTNQVLTLFLSAINLSEDQIGWFMSLTLVGDVVCSYILTWYADEWGRRTVLICGSIMMLLSGLVFSCSTNFYWLLIFAIFGVISPSSDEVGPFKSIEESMIAHLTPHNKRPEVYAIHAIMGTTGGALGALTCGTFLNLIKKFKWAKSDLQSYKGVFIVYAVIALGKMVIMLNLSKHTELDGHDPEDNDESQSLIDRPNSKGSLSSKTKVLLMKLLVIFMLDSLGYGFMTSGWGIYYYAKFFMMGSMALGTLFFSTQIVSASSSIPSSFLARYLGPVKAIISVQAPSAIFFMLIPLAENHLAFSIVFLILYSATTAMDVTPRQILLTNIIRPQDLTKVMGTVNIGKTMARCIGPIFTGMLAQRMHLDWCYVISGSLVIAADCVLAFWFFHFDKKIKRQIT
ncbi:probable Weak similarity to Staphylococcus multidrug resistance protein [Zygosaccharomyces bailii ISA1307]|nr:probable Weak similarity to Staphylococcus multidrug resistance protein [Zygosaccharomyces bailii ISA1307]